MLAHDRASAVCLHNAVIFPLCVFSRGKFTKRHRGRVLASVLSLCVSSQLLRVRLPASLEAKRTVRQPWEGGAGRRFPNETNFHLVSFAFASGLTAGVYVHARV